MSTTSSLHEPDGRATDNFIGTFVQLAGATAGGEALEFGSVTVAAIGVDQAIFNVAFVRRVDALDDLLQAVAWLRSRELPFVVRCICPVDVATAAAIAAIGLQPGNSMPGMILTNVVPVPSTPPPELQIAAASDAATMQHHADVCARNFGVPHVVVDKIFSADAMALPGVEFYVGYVRGVPVAASALFLSHGVAGIYNVATSRAHRQQGYGAALTRHAVRRGRHLGSAYSALQSSPMGRGVYEKMGFRETTAYATFLEGQA